MKISIAFSLCFSLSLAIGQEQLAIWTFPVKTTCDVFPCIYSPTTASDFPELIVYEGNTDDYDNDGGNGVAYNDTNGISHSGSRCLKWDDIKPGDRNYFEITLATTGFKDLKIRFDYFSEESGSLDISYRINTGPLINIINDQSITTGEVWSVLNLDLSTVTANENTSGVTIRVHGFDDSNDGEIDSDKLRFDNIEIIGSIISPACTAEISLDDASTDHTL